MRTEEGNGEGTQDDTAPARAGAKLHPPALHRPPVPPIKHVPVRYVLLALAIGAAGCGPGPSEVNPEGGLRGAIAQNSMLTQFSAAVEAGPLAAQLEAENITVFAPTDIAYRFAGAEALRRLQAESDVYASVLRRHVVVGRVDPAALTDGAELPTLEGTPLLVRRDGNRVTVGGEVVDLDPFDAGNGLLYEVDGFYMEHLDAETRLRFIPLADRFRDLLSRAGELDRLAGPDPVTVFAPINEAFVQLGSTGVDLLYGPTNGDILGRVARLHLASGRLRLDGPDGTLTLTTYDDFPLTLQGDGGDVTLSGVRVFTQPIETSTGVIYLIGGVILDGLTLEQRLRSTSTLLTFLDWVHAIPDLTAVLNGTEPHTLFAPNNAAIANIPDNVSDALRRPENAVLFSRVMSHHFVEGAVHTDDLLDGASIPSVEGSTLDVTRAEGAFRVDGRNFLRHDLRARNGVLHVIDGIVEPDVDAFDGALLRGMPAYTEVLRYAGLEFLARGPGPISVIGFTDEAIGNMPDLLSRPDLPSIIRYHMANGLIGNVQVGMTFIPLEGPPRTVTGFGGSGGGFLLDGAPFFVDLGPVTNGRLYQIAEIRPVPDPFTRPRAALRR